MHLGYLLKQIIPFPAYPWLHVQVKLPGVLIQLALESQLLVVASAHSSISVDTRSTYTKYLSFNLVRVSSRIIPKSYYTLVCGKNLA